MSEFALQSKIQAMIQSGDCRRIRITNSSNSASDLFDLIGERGFDKDFQLKIERVLLSETPNLSVEVFGGMRPDIVLSSNLSGQNRIIIEVKQATETTHKENDASQFVRYFLHLLVTSDPKPGTTEDIKRGFFVAAPSLWFEKASLSYNWRYFFDRYARLAATFGITLGEIRSESL